MFSVMHGTKGHTIPFLIDDFNHYMGGVDIANQKRAVTKPTVAPIALGDHDSYGFLTLLSSTPIKFNVSAGGPVSSQYLGSSSFDFNFWSTSLSPVQPLNSERSANSKSSTFPNGDLIAIRNIQLPKRLISNGRDTCGARLAMVNERGAVMC